MTRTAFRLIAPLALIAAAGAALPSLGVALRGQSAPLPIPKTANGRCTPPTLRGSKYSPLDQINASNFSKLEVAWRFKTDNLGPRPENKLEGTPIMIQGHGLRHRRHAAGGRRARRADRRAEVDLQPGRRAARALAAPRQLSGRGLSYWTDGKGDERIVYVTIGYRLVELNAKTGQPVSSLRQERHRRPEGRRGHRQGQADRSREGRNRPALDADRRRRHDHRRLVDVRRARLSLQHERQGPGPRVRRQDRQADLALQHDSLPRRVRQRHLGKRIRGSGPATSASGRRSPSIPKPASCICRSRRRRSTNTAATVRATTSSPRALVAVDLKTGRTQVALPARAPSAVGPRHLVGAAADRRDDRRPAAQAGRAADQAGLALRVRPHHRSADLADAGNAGAADAMSRARRPRRRSRSRPSRRPMRART